MKWNILSIDFDYFQTVSEETLSECYPDGIDLSTDLSKAVWMTHYGCPSTGRKLEKVGINLTKLKTVKNLIENHHNPIGCIVNSHRHIYKVIHDFCLSDDQICLYNLDMHHDMFNKQEEVDCGNWVSHIIKEYDDVEFRWFANPVSRKMFGLDEERFDCLDDDISKVSEKQWDIIFLCRSDNWTPPHLDAYFSELAESIKNNCIVYAEEKKVMDSRYDEAFHEAVRRISEQTSCFYADVSKIKENI